MSTKKKPKPKASGPKALLSLTFAKFPDKRVPVFFDTAKLAFHATFGFSRYEAASVPGLKQKIESAIKAGATPEPVWVPVIIIDDDGNTYRPIEADRFDTTICFSAERVYISLGKNGIVKVDWKVPANLRMAKSAQAYEFRSSKTLPKLPLLDANGWHLALPYSDELWNDLRDGFTSIAQLNANARKAIKSRDAEMFVEALEPERAIKLSSSVPAKKKPARGSAARDESAGKRARGKTPAGGSRASTSSGSKTRQKTTLAGELSRPGLAGIEAAETSLPSGTAATKHVATAGGKPKSTSDRPRSKKVAQYVTFPLSDEHKDQVRAIMRGEVWSALRDSGATADEIFKAVNRVIKDDFGIHAPGCKNPVAVKANPPRVWLDGFRTKGKPSLEGAVLIAAVRDAFDIGAEPPRKEICICNPRRRPDQLRTNPYCKAPHAGEQGGPLYEANAPSSISVGRLNPTLGNEPAPEGRHTLAQAVRPGKAKGKSSPGGATRSSGSLDLHDRQLHAALHNRQGKHRWDPLRLAGADDAQLMRAIGEEFGVHGNLMSAVAGNVCWRGGGSPAIWFDSVVAPGGGMPKHKPNLAGATLISAVRKLLDIPPAQNGRQKFYGDPGPLRDALLKGLPKDHPLKLIVASQGEDPPKKVFEELAKAAGLPPGTDIAFSAGNFKYSIPKEAVASIGHTGGFLSIAEMLDRVRKHCPLAWAHEKELPGNDLGAGRATETAGSTTVTTVTGHKTEVVKFQGVDLYLSKGPLNFKLQNVLHERYPDMKSAFVLKNGKIQITHGSGSSATITAAHLRMIISEIEDIKPNGVDASPFPAEATP